MTRDEKRRDKTCEEKTLDVTRTPFRDARQYIITIKGKTELQKPKLLAEIKIGAEIYIAF